MIAPFYPISRTHGPLLSPYLLVSRQMIGDRTVSFSATLFFLICPLVNKAEAGNYLTFIRFRGESMSLIREEARMELKSVHYGTWCRASDSCCTFFDIPGIHPFLSSLACLLHRVCRLSTGLGYARPSRFCRLSSCRDQDGRRFEGLLSVQLAFLRNE